MGIRAGNANIFSARFPMGQPMGMRMPTMNSFRPNVPMLPAPPRPTRYEEMVPPLPPTTTGYEVMVPPPPQPRPTAFDGMIQVLPPPRSTGYEEMMGPSIPNGDYHQTPSMVPSPPPQPEPLAYEDIFMPLQGNVRSTMRNAYAAVRAPPAVTVPAVRVPPAVTVPAVKVPPAIRVPPAVPSTSSGHHRRPHYRNKDLTETVGNHPRRRDDYADVLMGMVPLDSGSLYSCCSMQRHQPVRPRACKHESCELLIDVDAHCYKYQTNIGDKEIFICAKCYRGCKSRVVRIRLQKYNSPEDVIPTIEQHELPRNLFLKTTIRSQPPAAEAEIFCIECRRIYHHVCVLADTHTRNIMSLAVFRNKTANLFICSSCFNSYLGRDPLTRSDNTYLFTPEDLTESHLSQSMENDLKIFVFKYFSNRKLPEPSKFLVREVASRMKEFEAKPRMKEEFEKKDRPTKWAYRQRSIMVFQQYRTSFRWIAVFNMIVHEYPSTSSISLSYLDSVKLFEPDHFRSIFFKRVVVSYLRYMYKYFMNLYIWVCPPLPGDEYVFYGRPADSLDKKPRKMSGLLNWYKDVLSICQAEGIIKGYVQAGPEHNPYTNYLDIPYLVDDFWVEKLEVVLQEHDQEVQRWESEFSKASGTTKCSAGKAKRSRLISATPVSIQDRIDAIVKKEGNNQLFLIEFNSDFRRDAIAIVGDRLPDMDILSRYMSTRDKFIVDCRDNGFDFADSRRGIYTTMKMMSRIAADCRKISECGYCKMPFNFNTGLYCYQCDYEVFCNTACAEQHRTDADHSENSIRPFTKAFYAFGEGPVNKKLTAFKQVWIALRTKYVEGYQHRNVKSNPVPVRRPAEVPMKMLKQERLSDDETRDHKRMKYETPSPVNKSDTKFIINIKNELMDDDIEMNEVNQGGRNGGGNSSTPGNSGQGRFDIRIFKTEPQE